MKIKLPGHLKPFSQSNCMSTPAFHFLLLLKLKLYHGHNDNNVKLSNKTLIHFYFLISDNVYLISLSKQTIIASSLIRHIKCFYISNKYKCPCLFSVMNKMLPYGNYYIEWLFSTRHDLEQKRNMITKRKSLWWARYDPLIYNLILITIFTGKKFCKIGY